MSLICQAALTARQSDGYVPPGIGDAFGLGSSTPFSVTTIGFPIFRNQFNAWKKPSGTLARNPVSLNSASLG